MMHMLRWTTTIAGSAWGGLVAALGLAVVTGLTVAAGGTSTGTSQVYYLPIVAGALCYGLRGGALAGLAAGLLCGPLMPLDVAAGLAQSTPCWLLRLVVFVAIGTLIGAFVGALRQRIHALEAFAEEAVGAFVQTIDAKSPYTARHSERVAAFAVAIGQELGLPPHQVKALRWAGLLHDIGKLSVPDAVLNRAGLLTPAEWALVRQHPVESERMLAGIGAFRPYLPAVRHHHERLDGRGYPDGLAGAAIPLAARILAVADAFEAMTAERPYRPALAEEAALAELQAGAGRQFDATIVDALLRARAAARGDGRATATPPPVAQTVTWEDATLAAWIRSAS
jgi:putative nucleotidyltransferase with HDIG domain